MDINTLLTSDGDVDHTRKVLITIKTALQVSAHDYAKVALDAANEALSSVQKAAPAGAVWPYLATYQDAYKKANEALNATLCATGLLLNTEETGDLSVDNMNMKAKVDSVDVPVIHAMLEGAHARINLAMLGIPENSKAGQRTNPKALTPEQENKND